MIYANSYGVGAHAVVLGSNGCGAKESWEPQAQRLVAEGYKVLAIDFRGNGQSTAARNLERTTTTSIFLQQSDTCFSRPPACR